MKFLALLACTYAAFASTVVDRPAVFEKNEGQITGGALFVSRHPGYRVGFVRGGWNLIPVGAATQKAVRVRLLGSRREATVEGVDLLDGRTNYLIGSDASLWRTSIPNYGKLLYRAIYPGIDMLFHGTGRQLEYDFLLGPGANPDVIRVSFAGARKLTAGVDGDLMVETAFGIIRQARPRVFQNHQGNRVEIAGRYRIRGNTAEFSLDPYDRRRPVVIDPTLTFATYLGGSQTENQGQMAIDPAGNAYVTGSTFSADFPVTKAGYQPANAGAPDVFVSKFSSSGMLVYSTYVGGASGETASGIAVDSAGNSYVTGYTTSTNFPVVNPYQAANLGGTNGLDAFVFKLNPSGTALVYSTYLGGNDDDLGLSIAVDARGNAYVTGSSFSLNFPVTPGAFQGYTPGVATFVTKIAPSGLGLAYSTLVGGSGADIASSIAVDFTGNAYVAGSTSSNDFPVTQAAFQRVNHGGTTLGTDAFIYKLNPTGTGLLYATYLGGGDDEIGGAMTIDSTGAAYMTGMTNSVNFPVTPGVVQPALSGPSDAYVTKLDPTGSKVVFSTYFGGTRTDQGNAIAIDAFSNVYVAGSSTSTNLAMLAPWQATPGGASDAFAMKLNPSGSAILQSTYFGGSNNELVNGGALDSSGSFFVFGGTASSNGISTPGAYQVNYGGGNSDNFVAKFNFAIDLNSLTVSPTVLSFHGIAGANVANQTVSIAGIPGSNAAWTTAIPSGGAWLSASPASGNGTGNVSVAVNTTGLAAGQFSGTVAISDVTNNTKTTVPVTLTIAAPGAVIAAAGVVNGASFEAAPVSPGSIVTLFGTNFGSSTLVGAQIDAGGHLATLLSQTRVLFDGTPAPLIYVSATQIGAIVPYEISSSGFTQVQVEYNGVKSGAATVPIGETNPAIFTANSSGSGPGAVLNQDGSFNSAAVPAAKSSIVVLYVTGEGRTDPPGTDGQIAVDVFPKPTHVVSATIGGAPAEVLYAGAAPGLTAGVMQVNLRVPPDTQSGAIPITLSVGGAPSRSGVTIAVQ